MDLLQIIPWPAIFAALGCTSAVMLTVAVLLIVED